MKTSRIARPILKARILMFCLATIAAAAVGSSLGESAKERSHRETSADGVAQHVPTAGLAQALAAAGF